MQIELTDDEALVLFELLARADEREAYACEHEAEERVLWAIEAQLEKALSAPFRPDYRQMVDQARARVVAAS